MKIRGFHSTTRAILMLVVAGSLSALAQNVTPAKFSGLINDYSPETTVSPTGPWEMRGTWQLALKAGGHKADFSAEFNMELSDYSILCCGIDPDMPAERLPHSHLVKLVGGDVAPLEGGGFEVTGGTLVILKNGSPVLSPSTLTIDVTGGTTAAYSNIALTFGGDADGHFGTQPVNGNVQSAR